MAEPLSPETPTLGPHAPSESEVFTTLNHLVSRIDADDRVAEVVKKAADLDAEDKQLLVDCLSMALDKEAAPLNTRLFVWRSLIRVATSARIFAHARVLDYEHTTLENLPNTPTLVDTSGDASTRLKILKQAKKDSPELFTESLVAWVHLSHPNVLPLYPIFLQNEEGHLCLATPSTTEINICEYIQSQPEASRTELIADVAYGLSYLHRYGIVHGELRPETVLISDKGRAIITNLDHAEGRSTDSVPVRYLPPELLEDDDDMQASQASDVWMFACLSYEVLSGNAPFFQILREIRVSSAISTGSKPIRPGKDGAKGIAIDDAMWQLLLMCWEFKPADRPPCLSVHQIILSLDIRDNRPVSSTPILLPPGSKNGLTPHVETMKARLAQVVGCEHSPSLMVPERLSQLLQNLISGRDKFNATAAIAKKLSPEDTQMLVDFLDMVIAELGPHKDANFAYYLLTSIIKSTHVIPGFYKLNGIRYDPTPLSIDSIPNVHRGKDLKVWVHIAAPTMFRKDFLISLPHWAYWSHPNVFPFYGIFYEDNLASAKLCVVTPLWANRCINDYVTGLSSQGSRMPLILDIIRGMVYLINIGLGVTYETRGDIIISDQGRAVIACNFPVNDSVTALSHRSTYTRRFRAPSDDGTDASDVWLFGCLCYMILTRKEPYYQYIEESDIRAAIYKGELPRRPSGIEDDADEIGDSAWSLIKQCCQLSPDKRPTLGEVERLVIGLEIVDDRPLPDMSLESSFRAMRSRPNVNFNRVETLLGQIQIELLRNPLAKLLRNHVKDVVGAIEELKTEDVRTLVDFLDLVLTEHLPKSEEHSRALALLSRITSTMQIFPRRYELKAIRYHSRPVAEGGYGTVHRGMDVDVCVKVTTQVDPKALTPWIRELILWAHLSHPNILPFCGVLLKEVDGSQRICLVSPFMKNGNLNTYASRLSPRSRLALILDVATGLQYLHNSGVIHGDLKGENVLISNEGRRLITDFGTTHITTATAAATTSKFPTTLRYAAPEVVLNDGPPTRERDIWAFGCVCYETISRLPPYFQYTSIVQISVALARKEIPKRPGPVENNAGDGASEDGSDFSEAEDCDEIDDLAWNLITKCCEPEPGNRPGISAIREFIVDMKIWDDRSVPKIALGTEISKLRQDPVINLDRVGELLEGLQKIVVPTDQEEGGGDAFYNLWLSIADS
ncbi:hypothetical protein NP233_g3972 [Leucocoprinus birnbaumii]|uniref:Protein kinase domain-containing protein n=1 Tax=Leucocoprinus birnbaumii TaxID=56174 RepID=A0AAD5VZB8_9AGAR|nr:hypothetical protein NP233_g3972 [Leucocoprinus birnbaumii]